LHLKLPPEIYISKAHASLFRITFILDFGVPQIYIEVDGVQLHARLAGDPESSRARKPTSPPLRRQPSDNASHASSEADEEDIPTVDDLAHSFIREEPAEEIRELEEALHTQSEYMQESVASSDDGESSAGVGAPLGLPAVLRNLFNTALDRLRIQANHIDIEVEDQLPSEAPDATEDNEDPFVSLNFHIDQVVVDSVTSEDSKLHVTSTSFPQGASLVGRRRMRIENIYSRLISDAENFATMSRVSRPPSPADTRSVVSSSQKSQNEASVSQHDVGRAPLHFSEDGVGSIVPGNVAEEDSSSAAASHASLPRAEIHEESTPHSPHMDQEYQLASSVLTADEDRFADAASDDGLNHSITSDASDTCGNPYGQSGMAASSVMYDDHEGLLDYALQDDLFHSQVSDVIDDDGELGQSGTWGDDPEGSSHTDAQLVPQGPQAFASYPLSPPDRTQSFGLTSDGQHISRSVPAPPIYHSSDNLESANHGISDVQTRTPETSGDSPRDEDLSESKLFTHDDAESMYMSALSAGPSGSSFHPTVPGGWDSSSASSQGGESDKSAPIPAAMVAGSILGPLPEADDGCETPRPGSPQSVLSSPHNQHDKRHDTGSAVGDSKLAKLFLTVDQVTVWFSLGLNHDQSERQDNNSEAPQPEIPFNPPNLGQDSIFQEVPGSFSNYAMSTLLHRKGSIDTSTAARRPTARPSRPDVSSQTPKKDVLPTIYAEVGSVLGHIDFSTGRIMFELVNRFLKAVTTVDDSNTKQATDPPPPSNNQLSLGVSVKNVGIACLERLMTDSLSAGSQLRRLESDPLDAIIRISLRSLFLRSQGTSKGSSTKLQIGTFTLSSLDQDVISFVKPMPKRTAPSSGLRNDIEIDLEQTTDSRITIVTRPVKMLFDLQKLDDALSSFGGFSGILELGNSITSSNSPSSPTVKVPPQKPRGVHFGDAPPVTSAPSATPSLMPKIHVQFGEVSLLLKGKSCAVQLQTTSVRAAIRDSNVRLKVAEVRLSGPYTDIGPTLDVSKSGAPLTVEIKGTTVNFLFTPEEVDLSKLISMINPSKDPYENDEDILIDILLRQRRKGSVLRVDVASVGLRITDLASLQTLEVLGSEMAKLSKVTKYLPDDDRPGILTLARIQQFDACVHVNERLGDVSGFAQDAAVAHVGVPPLLAVELGKVTLKRGEELLIHEVVKFRPQDQLPMVMVRIVGDEVEPLIKAKLFNLCAEYHVSTILAVLGLSEDGTPDNIALGLASSIATITGANSPKTISRQSSEPASLSSAAKSKPLHLDLLLRSCALGLNPRAIPSKALFVLTDAHFLGDQLKEGFSLAVELRKASIHAIDDVSRISEGDALSSPAPGLPPAQRQLQELRDHGYVSLSSIAGAKASVHISGDGKEQTQMIEVELKNELFVLESCADSTQTLIAILNGLQPPSPPSTAQKYRTVVPLQEMMESFTGDAMAAPDTAEGENFMENADLVGDEVPTNLEFVGSIYYPESLPSEEDLGDSILGTDDLGILAPIPYTRQRGERGLLESFREKYEVAEGQHAFDFDDNYFKDSDEEQKGHARKFDSRKNQYHLANEFKTPNAPLKVRVRDVNVVWNLYDGYDWPRTRSIIAQAVDDVEARAEERRQRPRDEQEDEDFVEQDFLFNSVWIGVPIKDEKGALARRINRDIDDLASETGSYATSTATRSTAATARPRSATKSGRRRLKLERSKNKKIAFDLSGIAVDLIVFPPDSGETQSSVDVRIQEFEIYDHVPSSTWNKFVTSMIQPSQREMGRPMIDLEILTVKPVTELAASELVIRVTVQPLRLHVDQDALDFITRFFEFKDDSVPENSAPSEQPFIQRLEVMAVKLKLDYKPKRVDYRGLRSGHTTEFMNFLILDSADILLRHAIVYGITSFDKLHKTLNDVWMPDVQRNQLPTVLSGLAAVRPLVNVGSGVRDLVVVPMREYRKDGRIVRSLQKGVFAFAKNTTSEVARLGAKVAIGTQNLLEGAENFLNPQQSSPRSPSTLQEWDDFDGTDADDDERRAVSNYSNQPLGVKAGLRSAARHLERDLLTARDAIIAIPAEIMEEGTGVGVAKTLARRAPTVVLRPALGATKAVSNALLGVGNALDKDSARKIGDVSLIFYPYIRIYSNHDLQKYKPY
jgi:autophagy-related protein 2